MFQSSRTRTHAHGSNDHNRILVVHADDFGMTHSVNAASSAAFEAGKITSASIMVTCSWFPEAAKYLRSNPTRDFGVHLTLTSEWSAYRWGPVIGAACAPSLVGNDGFFHATPAAALKSIKLDEVALELQAQVDRAIETGLDPTHLDAHMYVLYQRPELFELFLALGRRNRIPCLVLRDVFDWWKLPRSLLSEHELLIDSVVRMRGDMHISAENWGDYYLRALEASPPGVTQMVIHVSFDDEEMRAVTGTSTPFGAEWRQRDFDFLFSNVFVECLRRNNFTLSNWRELRP